MLLSNCTTVDRVEKLSDDGAEYSRLWERAAGVAALGRVRAVLIDSRIAVVQALLATTLAVERRDSISSVSESGDWDLTGMKALPPAPVEHRVDIRVSQARPGGLSHETGGG
jgi:hypothetical protein